VSDNTIWVLTGSIPYRHQTIKTKHMENQLSIIVKESGLEQTKAQVLLSNFSNYFDIAAEWENKAKMLVVTDESQKVEMKMAREGRLFLKEKRVNIERTRKELKEQSLREGQTIDSIAKILKNLIEPIEEHLEKQEKFIEIKEAERKAARREERVNILTSLEYDFTYTDLLNMPDSSFDELVLKIKNEQDAKIEAARIAEEQRIAKEKAEREEQERIRLENERLKKEAEEREKVLAEERRKAEKERMELEAKAKAEREEAERKAELARKEAAEKERKQREEAERLLAIEREKQAKLEAELKAKVEAERKIQEEKERIEKEQKVAESKAAKAPDIEKLKTFVASIQLPQMPELKSADSIEKADSIVSKFNSFKNWALSQIDSI